MPEHEAWRLLPKVQPGQKYKDSLGVVVEIVRLLDAPPADYWMVKVKGGWKRMHKTFIGTMELLNA